MPTHFKNNLINVVGIYFTPVYKDPNLINQIEFNRKVLLKREPDNPHDKNAVSVYQAGVSVSYGYIPKELARKLAPILDRGSEYECFVADKRGSPKQPKIIISLTTFPIRRGPLVNPPDIHLSHRKKLYTKKFSPYTPTGKSFRRISDFKKHVQIYRGISGIYVIWNRKNKTYIGQSEDVGKRWEQHRNKLLSRSHINKLLQEDWVQMGADAFRFDLLEEIEPNKLDEFEKRYIEYFNSYYDGYNATPDGQPDPSIQKNKTLVSSPKIINTTLPEFSKVEEPPPLPIEKGKRVDRKPKSQPIINAKVDIESTQILIPNQEHSKHNSGWRPVFTIFGFSIIIPVLLLLYVFNWQATQSLEQTKTVYERNQKEEKPKVKVESNNFKNNVLTSSGIPRQTDTQSLQKKASGNYKGYQNKNVGEKIENDQTDNKKRPPLKDKNASHSLEDHYKEGRIYYYKKNDYLKARQIFGKIIEIAPSEQAYFYRASCWYCEKKFNEAIKDYLEVIKINKDNAEAFFYLGKAWEQKGDYEKALKYIAKAKELSPNQINYKNEYLNILQHLKLQRK